MKSLVLLITIAFTSSVFAKFEMPKVPANNQASCYTNLCKKVSPYGCRDSQTERRIMDACTRQVDLGCISVTLDSISKHQADEVDEVINIAKSCQYVKSQCHIRLMAKVRKHERDDLFEISQINDACYLVNPRCVSDALNVISIYQKDQLDEVTAIGKLCQGTYKYNCIRKLCAKSGQRNCNEISEVREIAKKCVSGPNPMQRRKL